MKDLIHEKFAKLMADVEKIEEELEVKEKDKHSSVVELSRLRGILADLRNELKRLSDGCGTHN